MAPQLTLTRGRERRALRLCTARATSSLPVPVSPTISTVVSVGATRSIMRTTTLSAALAPTISS